MLRISYSAGAIDMSRVERNAAFYEEGNTPSRSSKDRFSVFTGHLLTGLGVLFISFVLVSCLSFIAPKIAGYDAYVVASGSMEPNLPVGCIVYSKDVEPSQLRMGDVIVFNDPSRGTAPITHRVVTNNPFTQTITTKGDANDNEDVNPVSYENVVGIVKAHVPYLGYAVSLYSNILGKITAALLIIEAWLLTEIGRRLKAKGRAEKRNIEEAAA